jgi:hypothetical protein
VTGRLLLSHLGRAAAESGIRQSEVTILIVRCVILCPSNAKESPPIDFALYVFLSASELVQIFLLF